MEIIEDYLRKDLGINERLSFEEIRVAYAERAFNKIKNDWQSPAYLSSMANQAGRREGSVIGNINDYTRDQHDLAQDYEKKFVKEYMPRVSLLPLESYVTSSGMAALTTAIIALHRLHGTNVTVMLGEHSYFQNQEIIRKSFSRVVVFDENDNEEWMRMIKHEKPRVIFVDTLCNEPNLTRSPVGEIAKYLRENTDQKAYLVIDNTMLSIQFDWRNVLKYRSRKLCVIGWESLNKYYQFGMDRTTGGILWGSGSISVRINQARRHGGTIMSDMAVAMLPTPNKKIMKVYLERIKQNREILQKMIGVGAKGNGGQVVVNFTQKMSYSRIQKIIQSIIKTAKKERVQISAGSSFGFPTTRVYLTARQTEFTKMFLRICVGLEEIEEFDKVAKIIARRVVS